MAATTTPQNYKREAEMTGRITIRQSTDADRREILRLAELDSRRAPEGDALLAFVDDELRAAMVIGSGDAVADPFWPTAKLVELLRVTAGSRTAASGSRWVRVVVRGREILTARPIWRFATAA